MVIYVLFILCVLGFSVSACFSETADTYLRDKNPRIWCWNWTLVVFALVLANLVRLPLEVPDSSWLWLANIGLCVLTTAAIFFVVVFIAIIYHVFGLMFRASLEK